MPSPSSQLTSLRPDIAGSFMDIGLESNQAGFVWAKVFPVFEVERESGTFGRIPIAQLLERVETSRGRGSNYNRTEWDFEDVDFKCKEHGIEELVDEREAKIYADYFDAEVIAALRCRHMILTEAEHRFTDLVTDTGTLTNTDITNEWDDHANATPIDDVRAAKIRLFEATGLNANAIVMNTQQFWHLSDCAQIVDRITSSGAGESAANINAKQMAQALKVDHVYVAGGITNTANEGQAAVPDYVWPDERVLVCRVATTRDIKEPCIGRTFAYVDDGGQPMGTVESYDDPAHRGNVIRVRHDVHEKLIYPEAGQLLGNILEP